MARNKPEASATTRKAVKVQVPIIVRYMPIAIAAMADRIIAGDEAGAVKLRTEISEQLSFALRGVALQTVEALVDREWQLAQNFASPAVIDTAFDEANIFGASRYHSHDDSPIIEHKDEE